MFSNLSAALVFLLPMMTMRSIAGERRTGSVILLLTLPTSNWLIITAKYLSICCVGVILSILLSLYPSILAYLGPVNWASVVGSFIAFNCTLFAMIAVGLFSSTLTKEPLVAALIQVMICLPFWLLGSLLTDNGGSLTSLLMACSFPHQTMRLNSGLIDLSSLLFFAGFSSIFLAFSVHNLSRVSE